LPSGQGNDGPGTLRDYTTSDLTFMPFTPQSSTTISSFPISNALFQLVTATYIRGRCATATACHCSCRCQPAQWQAGVSLRAFLIGIIISGRSVPHVRCRLLLTSRRALVVVLSASEPAPMNDVSSIISNFSAQLQRLHGHGAWSGRRLSPIKY